MNSVFIDTMVVLLSTGIVFFTPKIIMPKYILAVSCNNVPYNNKSVRGIVEIRKESGEYYFKVKYITWEDGDYCYSCLNESDNDEKKYLRKLRPFSVPVEYHCIDCKTIEDIKKLANKFIFPVSFIEAK